VAKGFFTTCEPNRKICVDIVCNRVEHQDACGAAPPAKGSFAELGQGIACKCVRRKIFAVEIHRPQKKAGSSPGWAPGSE